MRLRRWRSLDVGLAATALLSLLWGAVVLAIRGDERAAVATAFRDTANMVRTVEAQVAGRIEAIDARLRFAQELYARDPERFSFGAWSGVDPEGDIPVGLVVGLDGRTLVGPPGTRPDDIDRSDLDAVRSHLDHPTEDRLFVGPPFIGRLARRRVLAFSRPLRRDGEVVGVAIFGVDAASFSRLYRDLDIGGGVIALIGLDGVVRAWAPESGMVGRTLPREAELRIPSGAVQVSRRLSAAEDGVERFVTLRQVGGQPLVVMVGLPAAQVLAPVWSDRNRLLLLGLLLSVLIVVVSVLLLQRRRAAGRAHAVLEAAVGHISQGILMVDPQGRVALANARAIELLGLPPGLAVPGRPLRDIIAWQLDSGEFGQDPVPDPHLRSIASAPGAPPDLYERVRPDGTVLEIRTEHLPDGSHVRTYTDLTAPRRDAQVLAEARDRALAAEAALAAVIENVPHGVLMVDAENRIVVMTRRALEMLDLPASLGRPGTDVRELYRAQVARGDLATAPDIDSGGTRMVLTERPPAIATYERELRNGRVIEVRTTVLADGRAVRTYTDVSERRAAAAAQEAARLAAEANARARTEFLAMVSHELRTPLNAVIGLSGLLLQQQPREDQAQHLHLIREAGEHLLALVNDILDVTRLERGEMALRQESFDPRESLGAAVGIIRPQAEAKGLSLSFEVADTVPRRVVGDVARLRQVLLKLLGNAVKYTEQGGIRAMLSVLSAGKDSVRLGITVADTGIGVPPEAQARLFSPFSQGEGGVARRFGGLGLGLAICRMLLERMGGSIRLESEPGTGSVFRCEVPLRRAEPLPAPSAGPWHGPLRILVAEDVLANRLLINHSAARLGHAVDTVQNGREAVEAVQARSYDLVIMDVLMPVLDGVEATRAIRALPGPAGRVPIIGLTSHAAPETEAECLEAGMDRFARKPIGPDALRAAIAAVLETRAVV
ncbi:PAS-domain containing protein [Roseicella frigidaeris]|uniref:histidine kinase n=1 Tax=Roseicella frigidaeris TaxID=2230885 RepID=A0A327M616_9PROT|nr:PAS-domain containing protein [Roseicella frigidaeris]RAI57865.1 hypothetical protein DOO78_16590 [Roseicella frigidaeris]